MDCPFCNQIEPERIVVEKDLAVALICLEPLNPGHILVCPKRHVEKMEDLTAEESQEIFRFLGSLETTLRKIFADDPIVFINRGSHGSQAHLHLHLLPSKGGIRDLFSAYEQIPPRISKPMSELAIMAEAIKAKM